MNYDVVAKAVTPPVLRPFEAERTQRAADAAQVTIKKKDVPAVVFAAPSPHRVELSLHEDLKVLMTRVVDAQTGDLVREYPARQVLDLVADVIARIRAQEARS